MKKLLCLTRKPEPHATLWVKFVEFWDIVPEIEEKFDEIIVDYAHLIETPEFMHIAYDLLTDNGVLDITVPQAGCPASFEDPFTKSFWTPETFLYYQVGPHSLRRSEYVKILRCGFSIDIGMTERDTRGNIWIRARCTKIPMETPNG